MCVCCESTMVISIRKEGLNVGIYDFRYTIIGR